MRRSAALTIVGVVALMLTTLTSVGAQAAPPEATDGPIIYGGTTQSVDPTATTTFPRSKTVPAFSR